jgi:RNA:NAD 2'-phosphotransferase (TPT1/KptA family)
MWHWARRESPERQDREAEKRLEHAKKLADQSRHATAALRRELDKNGWTELLQNAMGGR